MNKYLNELISKIKSGEFELIETTLSNKEIDSETIQTTYGFVVKSKNPQCFFCGAEGTLQLENDKWICEACAMAMGERSEG
ncbi:hypothetical protein Lpp125_00892 [Lacticaseibacillus paracasei subsp. paracasei Lpp125]|uniref:hypothetical protein n=1 Tax=Lacticaseibacillus paracasei TaxID=1597 RepID=UPI00034348D9|nr:hypothetical protein [Lacticaseibacillus paracasei]EPD02471.1 hypothetical protein Lpp125_00892 [Lacticaseibacillus paracasei subsp. paracasei Lpp125]